MYPNRFGRGKRGHSCSVENLNPPHNHQIVGDDFQVQRSVLSVVGLGVQRFAEPSLQHADDRFDLPALSAATAFGRAADSLLLCFVSLWAPVFSRAAGREGIRKSRMAPICFRQMIILV
jgi:hypothetical protein